MRSIDVSNLRSKEATPSLSAGCQTIVGIDENEKADLEAKKHYVRIMNQWQWQETDSNKLREIKDSVIE